MNISFSILVIYLLFDLVTPTSDIPTSQTVLLIQVGRVQLVQSFSGKPVYNCNGIIVRPWWILTSARCLVNSYFQFRFAQGSSVLIGCSSTGSNCPSYELQTIIPHPCFNPLDGFYHDDLALLQIKADPAKPTPVSSISIDGVDGAASIGVGTPFTWSGIFKAASPDVSEDGPQHLTAKIVEPLVCTTQFQGVAAIVDGQTRIELKNTLCTQDDAPESHLSSFLSRGDENHSHSKPQPIVPCSCAPPRFRVPANLTLAPGAWC